MAERTLETRYRVLAAAFADGPRGAVWKERGARDMREALDLLVHVLGKDIALEPDVLDREHLHTMVTEILPGRLSGKEAYCSSILDLAEDLLLFIAEEEGISKQWEWTSAVNESREAFDRALADDERPRFGVGPATPERRPGAKIGRNDPCPCGSGKKYKQCCLRLL